MSKVFDYIKNILLLTLLLGSLVANYYQHMLYTTIAPEIRVIRTKLMLHDTLISENNRLVNYTSERAYKNSQTLNKFRAKGAIEIKIKEND